MAIDTATSEILASLQQKTAGSFDRIKNCEAKAGGRELPANLKGAIGQANRMKLDKGDNGAAYAYLYASTCEPPDQRGIACGVYFPLAADTYNSEEQNQEKMWGTLKLLGYQQRIEACRDSIELWRDVFPFIMTDLETRQFCFEFKTGRERKAGSPNVLIQGLAAPDYHPPQITTGNQHAAQGYQPAPGASAPQRAAPGSAPKKTPPGSAPKKGPPPKKNVCPVAIGDFVETIGDPYGNGLTYTGKVIGILEAEKAVDVEVDGEPGYQWEWKDIKKSEPKKGLVANQAVKTTPTYFGDNKQYDGVIVSIAGEQASVKFTSGDVMDIELTGLVAA